MEQFKIVKSSSKWAFEFEVNKLLREGWSREGELEIIAGGWWNYDQFVQRMIREHDGETGEQGASGLVFVVVVLILCVLMVLKWF